MLKAVIFDMDGTLLDSVDYHAQAWQDAFKDYGHSIDFQAIRKEIGKGGDQLLPVFLSESEIADMGEQLEAHRGALLKERYLSKFAPFPQVRGLFQRLTDDGIKTVLASSSKADELKVYKAIARIEDLVDEDVSSEDAEKSKPEPDIFHAALKKLPGLDCDQIMVIGDTPHDARAASKAGLRTIGVLCGGVPEAVLREAGCVAVYGGPADLLEAYETWVSGEA